LLSFFFFFFFFFFLRADPTSYDQPAAAAAPTISYLLSLTAFSILLFFFFLFIETGDVIEIKKKKTPYQDIRVKSTKHYYYSSQRFSGLVNVFEVKSEQA